MFNWEKNNTVFNFLKLLQFKKRLRWLILPSEQKQNLPSRNDNLEFLSGMLLHVCTAKNQWSTSFYFRFADLCKTTTLISLMNEKFCLLFFMILAPSSQKFLPPCLLVSQIFPPSSFINSGTFATLPLLVYCHFLAIREMRVIWLIFRSNISLYTQFEIVAAFTCIS